MIEATTKTRAADPRQAAALETADYGTNYSASYAYSQRKKRLPAHGRRIRAEILAGRRPRLGGGCITVKTDWKIRCPIASLVCPPDELSADGWELSFLRGVEILLLYRMGQSDYVQSLVAELAAAGCSLVSAHVVPEAFDA